MIVNVIFMNKIKILNLYAGIGGNRKKWVWNNIDVTAVEINPKIAKIYQDNFPEDKVIVTDAHKYLLEHFKEFDFIWSSPPCPTHSKLRTLQNKIVYPDMNLYQEIILLKKWFNGKYVIENVNPYYKPLIRPTAILHRHCFWSNFRIPQKEFKKLKTCKIENEREVLQHEFGFDLSKYSGVDKRLLLRNCIVPELGYHILKSAYSDIKTTVADFHSTETHNSDYAVRKSEISSPKVLASPKPIA